MRAAPETNDPASVVSALIKLLAARLRRAWPGCGLLCAATAASAVESAAQARRVGHRLRVGRAEEPDAGCNSAMAALEVADRHRASGAKERLIGEFTYAARSWNRERRVIARLEHGPLGSGRALHRHQPGWRGGRALRTAVLRSRGGGEPHQEAQLDLFGRRGSCHRYAANQMRLLLAALAYTLMIQLRRLALVGTELQVACTATIRTRLLKFGAAVLRNTDGFASCWPASIRARLVRHGRHG